MTAPRMAPATSPGDPPPTAPHTRSNLALRLSTAAVGLPIVLGLTWVGGWPFAIVAGVIAFLAAAEFVAGWLFPSRPIAEVFVRVPSFAAAPVIVAGAHWDPRIVLAGLIFAAVFAAIGYARTSRIGPRRPYRVLSGCLVYTGAMLGTLVLVRDIDGGRSWVFLGLLSTFAVDTGAYAVGKLTGRHKMAPRISPGKTWEGAAGGYAAGTGAVFALNALADTGVAAATIAPLALALPVFAQVGDLFESWMKRRMGVKDASGLLPGHGGFMDRLDSVVFVFPLLYVFLQLRVL